MRNGDRGLGGRLRNNAQAHPKSPISKSAAGFRDFAIRAQPTARHSHRVLTKIELARRRTGLTLSIGCFPSESDGCGSAEVGRWASTFLGAPLIRCSKSNWFNVLCRIANSKIVHVA